MRPVKTVTRAARAVPGHGRKLGWLVLVLAAGLLMLAPPVPAQEGLTDASIADAVEDEIYRDPAIRGEHTVTASEGIVTLTGHVPSLVEKERAARVAGTVRGVKAVVNRIQVEPAEELSPTQLEAEVNAALLGNPATDSFEIDVQATPDGAITLRGSVESYAERDLIGNVAGSVSGVTALDNEVRAVPKAKRADFDIENEVEQSLYWHAFVDQDPITVEVRDGVVSLSGRVGSAAEKRLAESLAWTAGVTGVDVSALEVIDSAAEPYERKAPVVARGDDEIRQAVERALTRDPRVNAFAVGVRVRNGQVTLEGTVDTLQAKRSAAMDARNTTGVVDVRNRLEVRPETVTIEDAQIAERVRQALSRDPYVERQRITVTVTDGIVKLFGVVNSFFEKGQADHVASSVPGVLWVDNELLVESPGEAAVYDPYTDGWSMFHYDWYEPARPRIGASDTELARNIRDQLWWSPFVDSDKVDVSVEAGVVTLEGTVDSRRARGAAISNAFEAGATWVINRLEIAEG